jgi:hypothetical protein
MKGKGANIATSQGESAVTAAATADARASASCLVPGFSFQFPVMKGLRSYSSVPTNRCWEARNVGAVEKADAAPTPAAMTDNVENLIVPLFRKEQRVVNQKHENQETARVPSFCNLGEANTRTCSFHTSS